MLVVVVEVDVIRREAFERPLARSFDVLGAPVKAAAGVRIVGIEAEAELSRDPARRPPIARPTSSSLVYGPYTSAVSKNVTPSSSAR